MEFIILLLQMALIAVFFLGLALVIIGAIGRHEKKKYLPIKSLSMTPKEKKYVIYRLSMEMPKCEIAAGFCNKLIEGTLREEDLPQLNEYLSSKGMNIGPIKVF